MQEASLEARVDHGPIDACADGAAADAVVVQPLCDHCVINSILKKDEGTKTPAVDETDVCTQLDRIVIETLYSSADCSDFMGKEYNCIADCIISVDATFFPQMFWAHYSAISTNVSLCP